VLARPLRPIIISNGRQCKLDKRKHFRAVNGNVNNQVQIKIGSFF
jgi:hypothetical protein